MTGEKSVFWRRAGFTAEQTLDRQEKVIEAAVPAMSCGSCSHPICNMHPGHSCHGEPSPRVSNASPDHHGCKRCIFSFKVLDSCRYSLVLLCLATRNARNPFFLVCLIWHPCHVWLFLQSKQSVEPTGRIAAYQFVGE